MRERFLGEGNLYEYVDHAGETLSLECVAAKQAQPSHGLRSDVQKGFRVRIWYAAGWG